MGGAVRRARPDGELHHVEALQLHRAQLAGRVLLLPVEILERAVDQPERGLVRYPEALADVPI